MRISKIFHWLYASVLLMPIFAIGVKTLYVAFNPNAKDSYYGETINEVIVTQVNYDNLQINHTYVFNNPTITPVTTSNVTTIYVNGVKDINNNIEYTNATQMYFFMYPTTNATQAVLYILSNTETLRTVLLNNNSTQFEFRYIGISNDTDVMQYFNYFFETTYNDYSYIDNVFYYSVDQISNEPLFSWAKTSFLAQPLLFITNLFGLPSTSPIITFLSYWFDISIIWLVFDAIMYFPLLIHRWLDKGVIE